MRCPNKTKKAKKTKTFHAAAVYVCMHCGLIAAVFGGFCVCGASHLRSDFLVHTGGQDEAQDGQDEAQEGQEEAQDGQEEAQDGQDEAQDGQEEPPRGPR